MANSDGSAEHRGSEHGGTRADVDALSIATSEQRPAGTSGSGSATFYEERHYLVASTLRNDSVDSSAESTPQRLPTPPADVDDKAATHAADTPHPWNMAPTLASVPTTTDTRVSKLEEMMVHLAETQAALMHPST